MAAECRFDPNRFRSALQAAGLRQADVARALGVNPASVAGWATKKPPGRENLLRLAKLLGVSAEWLLGQDPPSTTAPAADTSAAAPTVEGTAEPTVPIALLVDALHIAKQNADALRELVDQMRRLIDRLPVDGR